jgi:hypothetical protein
MTTTAPNVRLCRYRIEFTNPNGVTDGLGSISFTVKAPNRYAATVLAKKLVCTKLKMPDFICTDDGERADRRMHEEK